LASAGGGRTTTDGMPVVCFFFLVAALDWTEGTFWAGMGEAASERTFDLDVRRSLHGLLSAAGHSSAEDLVPSSLEQLRQGPLLLLLSAPATSGQGENAVEVGRTQWTGRWVTHTGVLKVFGKNITSDVSYVVGRSFRILKKLIAQLPWKQRDKFIKTN
jgi:hypothetical protein